MAKIGINGFGRIGRLLLRAAHCRKLEVVAINNPKVNAEYIGYMLKFDSLLGRFPDRICMDDKSLILGGKHIQVFQEVDASKIKWKESGALYIAECSGQYMNMDGAKKHLANGAKRVVISAPAKGVPMFICGLNLENYKPDMQVISCSSCTSNALGPLAKVINEKFSIEEGLMTSIFPATSGQRVVDNVSPNNWRNGRSALCNIIPSETLAAKAIGSVYPPLKCKLHGMGFRVPIANVSLLDFNVRVENETNLDCIKKALLDASEGELFGILGYTQHKVVSSDFIGDPHSCIFDSTASMQLNENVFKLVGWYDNEWAYANRVLDLILHMAKLDEAEASKKDNKKKCVK